MDILFIRHGHAEHLLDYPNRLDTLHPSLTAFGRTQVGKLRTEIEVMPDDLLLVSPTQRTIETAHMIANRNPFFICPFIGPRMYPQSPDNQPLQCDLIYNREELQHLYPELELIDLGIDCWTEGINTIEQQLFESYAAQLLEWCSAVTERAIIVSHDGTITSYRAFLGEQGLTRQDFLGEAGMYHMKYGGETV